MTAGDDPPTRLNPYTLSRDTRATHRPDRILPHNGTGTRSGCARVSYRCRGSFRRHGGLRDRSPPTRTPALDYRL